MGDLAATGFGSVTTDLGRALIDLGHDVRFLSQNDLEGIPPEPFGSRTLDLAFYEMQATAGGGGRGGVAGVRDLVGDIIDGTTDAMLASGDPWGGWRPDAIVLLGDFWAVRIVTARFEEQLRRIPVFHYVPIEGTNLPPRWNDLWSWIHPIAMSRFGAEQIALVTGQLPPMAYHGVDTDAFHPATPTSPVVVPIDRDRTRDVRLASRDAARRFFMGAKADPAQFWFVRTDRNMPRKRFGAMLRGMSPVLAAHPEARLVLHCQEWDQGGDLLDEISKMPPPVARQVILPGLGAVPREVLVALLNASDAYVSTGAEGFGLCVAESLACGLPAIGLGFSAVPEVIGPGGIVVPPAFAYDNEYNHYWASPDEDALADAATWLVEHPARARELGQEGMRHVRSTFRWSEAARVIAEAIASVVEAAPAGADPVAHVGLADPVGGPARA